MRAPEEEKRVVLLLRCPAKSRRPPTKQRPRVLRWSHRVLCECSSDVAFSITGKNIDDERVFDGRHGMVISLACDEAVAGAIAPLSRDAQSAAHDTNNLLMRVAVPGTHPTFFQAVLGEEELVVIGEHLAREPALRTAPLSIGVSRQENIRRISGSCSGHSDLLVREGCCGCHFSACDLD